MRRALTLYSTKTQPVTLHRLVTGLLNLVLNTSKFRYGMVGYAYTVL
eukprot:SAG31_NODE_125_length_23649_cov_7.156202_3_plen_47_part_00